MQIEIDHFRSLPLKLSNILLHFVETFMSRFSVIVCVCSQGSHGEGSYWVFQDVERCWLQSCYTHDARSSQCWPGARHRTVYCECIVTAVILMEDVDKGCPMIRMGVSGWMFPAYPGSPGPKAIKWLYVCVCPINGRQCHPCLSVFGLLILLELQCVVTVHVLV